MTLPDGWVETTLQELGRWGSGGTPKATEASYYGGSIPWIRSGDLPDKEITAHVASLTESGLQNSSAKWVSPGSILIAMYGATIGKLGITTYPVTTNQAVAFLEPSEELEKGYIFENLRSRKQRFIELGQGGAQPNISQEIIKAQPIALPPVAEQRRIVTKLDALTARIALIRE
jgi:type I restriction enzyme S subunit